MECGHPECSISARRRRKLAMIDGMWFPSGEVMKTILDKSKYKYPRVSEANRIKQHDMKARTIVASKQNGRNDITGIMPLPVATVVCDKDENLSM